jgi:glycosyltransferase involved in cell wall biosynthesis
MKPIDRTAGLLSNRFAHVVVANSSEGAREAIRDESLKPEKVRVIHNGVDIPRVAGNPETKPPVGLMIANFIPYKGHRDLIQALSQLSDVPMIRLVGDGFERSVIEEEVMRAGLGGFVRFEGRVMEAKTLYVEAQFGLLVSHQEGMPNAVIEGMAAGIPMIATAVGGIPEILEDDVTGLLVPPQNPPALATAISRLVQDPQLRARLGTAAREKAKEWSWDHCTDRHLALYREFGARG